MKRVIWVVLLGLWCLSGLHAESVEVELSQSSSDAYEALEDNTVTINDTIINLGCANTHNNDFMLQCGGGGFFSFIGMMMTDEFRQEDGLHFAPVDIPFGATINYAYITFTSSNTQNTETNITIVSEALNRAPRFSTDENNITDRVENETTIEWSVEAWSQDQKYNVTVTPIISEVVIGRGWENNHTIVLLFKPSSGCKDETCFRQFYSQDQNSSVAPRLTINFTPPPDMPPVVHDIPDTLAEVNVSFSLDLSTYVSKTNGDPITAYHLEGTLPHGLSYDASTQIISGTPDTLGEQYLSLYATDKDGDSNTDSFIIAVVTPDPYIDLRMDECYWMGGSNGVTEDILDYSGNGLDATSRNKADNVKSDALLCRSGAFINNYADTNKSDAVYYPNTTGIEEGIAKYAPFSISLWLKKNNDKDKWMAGIIKVSDDSWKDGWGIIHQKGTQDNEIHFFVDSYEVYAKGRLNDEAWTHVVGTYDGSDIRLYIDGKIVSQGWISKSVKQSNYTPGALALSIGDDISGSSTDDRWQGGIDEVKVWGRVLDKNEIKAIYDNESDGKNYDTGEARICQNCTSAHITAKSWELVGIPADSRQEEHNISNTFGDDMNGSFNSDWRLYRRVYSESNNSSWYEHLDSLSDTLEFGVGYWLGSKLSSDWGVDKLAVVDYNSTSSACGQDDTCVEIPLKAVTLDESDGDSGAIGGPYRYNFSGYIGIEKPVEWADCRFLIDGDAYTPSEANDSKYANKQVWLYAPNDNKAGNNGYITCADDSAEGCKLLPFQGFIVELNGATKGKEIKLLIPKR